MTITREYFWVWRLWCGIPIPRLWVRAYGPNWEACHRAICIPRLCLRLKLWRWWHRRESVTIQHRGSIYNGKVYRGHRVTGSGLWISYTDNDGKGWSLCCDPIETVSVNWTTRDGKRIRWVK